MVSILGPTHSQAVEEATCRDLLLKNVRTRVRGLLKLIQSQLGQPTPCQCRAKAMHRATSTAGSHRWTATLTGEPPLGWSMEFQNRRLALQPNVARITASLPVISIIARVRRGIRTNKLIWPIRVLCFKLSKCARKSCSLTVKTKHHNVSNRFQNESSLFCVLKLCRIENRRSGISAAR